MKLIGLHIEDDNILRITCKKKWYEGYLEEIDKITYYLKAKDLSYKYLGWQFDENNNIVFTFILHDYEKDIKPYLFNDEGSELVVPKLDDDQLKLLEKEIKKYIKTVD